MALSKQREPTRIKKDGSYIIYHCPLEWRNKRGVDQNMKRSTSCEYCANYVYDEDSEGYYCDVSLDEDEYYRFVSSGFRECPYYQSGDEYKIVRHQM